SIAASLREAATSLRMTNVGSGQLRFRNGRAPVEAEQICVPDVTQVLDSNLAGKKAVGGHLAEESKELHPRAQACIFLSILPVGNQVENFLLLFWSAIEISLAISVTAFRVEPHYSATELQLIFGILAGEQIDKFGRTRFHRAAGIRIGGNNGLA